METVRFWGREGGKLVSFVAPDKERFIPLLIDNYLQAARAQREATPRDAVAIGGHLVLGRNPAESADIRRGFLELFDYAYNAPPYNVPVGRLWEGSRQQVADEIGRLNEAYGVDEFFLWHHVGYFPDEVEMAMLAEFAAAVISGYREAGQHIMLTFGGLISHHGVVTGVTRTHSSSWNAVSSWGEYHRRTDALGHALRRLGHFAW